MVIGSRPNVTMHIRLPAMGQHCSPEMAEKLEIEVVQKQSRGAREYSAGLFSFLERRMTRVPVSRTELPCVNAMAVR